jgi:hypothetical protein
VADVLGVLEQHLVEGLEPLGLRLHLGAGRQQPLGTDCFGPGGLTVLVTLEQS